MDLLVFKIISFLSILLITVFTCFAVVKWGSVTQSKKKTAILEWFNVLTSGVFLGAGLLHMLPDASEHIEDSNISTKIGPCDDYPLAQLLATLGFFLIWFIDNAASHAHDKHTPEEHDLYHNLSNGHDHNHDHGNGHDHSHIVFAKEGKSSFVPLLLVILLSIHASIAGLALGIEDSVSGTATILVAILGHKFVEAGSVAVAFVKEGQPLKKCWHLLTAYVLMTPGGIFLGTVLESVFEGDTADAVEGVITAIAAGSFLYVAFIILSEKSSIGAGSKLLAAMLGLATMAILAIYV
eukprot:TRINITY_DN774397_c0_g1_i1.p1 TRINITY_DN774397_c0_g1~~TRINITY_DN774397_c0_g1_i1.p1  ORF type:complete len:295 (+),score=59.85 TRINITY_DN774397_c0_g1_i1:157-1041(+)